MISTGIVIGVSVVGCILGGVFTAGGIVDKDTSCLKLGIPSLLLGLISLGWMGASASCEETVKNVTLHDIVELDSPDGKIQYFWDGSHSRVPPHFGYVPLTSRIAVIEYDTVYLGLNWDKSFSYEIIDANNKKYSLYEE